MSRSAPPGAAARRAARPIRSAATTRTLTRPSSAERARLGGDRVGDQQRVVEAVDRALRARGEHADDAREDGRRERPAGEPTVASLARIAVRLMLGLLLVEAERHAHLRVVGVVLAELERLGERRDQRQAEAEARASRGAARCRGRCRG